MVKKIEVRVKCPECGHKQTYHSHRSRTKGERRKSCNRCGKSFSVRKQRVDRLPSSTKDREKPDGFFKYSMKS